LVDDEPPARDRLRRILSAHRDVEICGEAANGVEALERVDELRPDVVFLDVQLPEMDGLEVAASMSDDGPAVVFVTAFDSHALRAFELAAVDYLLKPVTKDRLRASLDRVRAARSPSRAAAHALLSNLHPERRKMAVRCGAKYLVFDTDRIAAVLAQDHYATILVDDQELLSDESLDKIMTKLDAGRFLRVHRGAILNLTRVRELKQEGDRKYVALVAGGGAVEVPVSRDRLDEVKARLGIT
jgi:DNA-binding LytR/AlgR family response regulator